MAGVQPGKLLADLRQCNVGYGGKSYVFQQFEELAGPGGGFWGRPEISTANNLERVQGGHEADGRPLYVCRAKYNLEGFQIGKLVAGNCNFEWGGKEMTSADQVEFFYVPKKPAIGWFWMSSDESHAPKYRNITAEEGDLPDPNAEFVADRAVVCRARLLNSLGVDLYFQGHSFALRDRTHTSVMGRTEGQPRVNLTLMLRSYR